jgi:hypothetical protein
MYARTFWVDHVIDQYGEIIQQGTLLDQLHFNNLEVGLSDQSVAVAFLLFRQIQKSYSETAEWHTVTMTGNGQPWPFNNEPVTVALEDLRENTNYSVEVCVTDYSGGLLGHIRVYDRALNGFKLLHDGSATSVQVSVRVSGGLI